MLRLIVSAKDNAANSEERCLLQPHWYGLKMLCSRKYSRSYKWTALSSSLETVGKIEMGL